MATLEKAKIFSEIFSGFSKAHGRCELLDARREADGKREMKPRTIKQPLTDQDWLTHLNGGRYGVGVIPLRDDDTVVFSAGDVDGIAKFICHDFLPLSHIERDALLSSKMREKN